MTTGLLVPTPEGTAVNVQYRLSDSKTTRQDIFTPDNLTLDLTPGFAEDIISGGLIFNLGGKQYYERNGSLYADHDPKTDSGVFAGTLSLATGTANITTWTSGAANTAALKSIGSSIGRIPVVDANFIIPQAPVKVESVQVRATALDGTLIDVRANAQGEFEGGDCEGWAVYDTGVINVHFGNTIVAAGNEGEPWYTAEAVDDNGNIFKPIQVYADTVLYNAVSQTFIPLDPDILGLDPVRLPQDGRVPVYADGDVVVVLHDQTLTGTYNNAQVLDFGRGRLAKLIVRDSADQEISEAAYTADLDAGTITFDDVSGISQPIKTIDRIEDMMILVDVQITGRLTLSQSLTHDFPADETLVANAAIYGDKFAYTSTPFDQATWSGEWSDELIGSETSAQYNNSQYPIEVDNASAAQERFYCQFVNSTTVNVIGEHLGQILSGASIFDDIVPINPNTSQPYFTIPAGGWGAGWASGNILRFNGSGANFPSWLIQSVGQGEETDNDYNFCLEVRGDIDTP